MSFFCTLFGHTWIPESRVPSVRWNTTKDGQVLNPTVGEQTIQHLDVCRRCQLERPAGTRRHDSDRPTLAATGGGDEAEE